MIDVLRGSMLSRNPGRPPPAWRRRPAQAAPSPRRIAAGQQRATAVPMRADRLHVFGRDPVEESRLVQHRVADAAVAPVEQRQPCRACRGHCRDGNRRAPACREFRRPRSRQNGAADRRRSGRAAAASSAESSPRVRSTTSAMAAGQRRPAPVGQAHRPQCFDTADPRAWMADQQRHHVQQLAATPPRTCLRPESRRAARGRHRVRAVSARAGPPGRRARGPHGRRTAARPSATPSARPPGCARRWRGSSCGPGPAARPQQCRARRARISPRRDRPPARRARHRAGAADAVRAGRSRDRPAPAREPRRDR